MCQLSYTTPNSLQSITMSDLKQDVPVVVEPRDAESQASSCVSEKRGTSEDQKDMQRMGKTQELRRNFKFVSIFGYSMVLMATWETVLMSVTLHHNSILTTANVN